MGALTIKALKGYSTPLADFLATGGVDLARLAAIAPGGEDNPGRTADAYLKWYGSLRVLRAQVRDDAVSSPEEAIAAADRLILEALAATPIPVSMSGEQVDDFFAHPKSCLALLKVHTRNIVIKTLLSFVQDLKGSDDPGVIELVDEALTEVVYQHQVICWIACTEGPMLPFAWHESRPALPERFAHLSSLVIPAICQAFDRANGARLQALEFLISPDDDEDEPSTRKRPSWSQFIANTAGEESAEDVMRNRALVSVFAKTQLVASTHRDAMAESKRRSEQREVA